MPVPERFADFLREALRLLRRRTPVVYGELHRHLRGRRLHLRVGSEELTVSTTSRGLRIARGGSAAAAGLRAQLEPAALVRLTDGTSTLPELIHNEEVRLWGPSDEMLRWHEAARIFLETAVRSPRLQQLFERYRRWAGAR